VLNQQVNQASTYTWLGLSANPSAFGQPVTFTAAVSAATLAGGLPTGSIVFMDGTSSLGTASLNNGVATFTTTALYAGSHSITAFSLGDGNFTGSNSATLTQVVNNATPTTTSLGPTSVAAGSGSFTLTINGSDFLPGSTVQWAGTALTVTAGGATQL